MRHAEFVYTYNNCSSIYMIFPYIYGGCVCVPDTNALEPDSVHYTQMECLLGGSFKLVKLLLLLYPKHGQCGKGTHNCGLPFVIMAMLWCEVFIAAHICTV